MRTGLAAAAVAAVLATTAACTDGGPSVRAGRDRPEPSPTPTLPVTPATGPLTAGVTGDTATVDNRWFPLAPGRHYVYRGASGTGAERRQHSVDFTVTDLTKRIDGVAARVVYELDFTDGVLEEAELAYFAQDARGNVWHVGEYPEEYEEGAIVKSPGWIHGVAGARAGIEMPASPLRGLQDWAQGFAPDPIGWADRAETYRTGRRVCVPVRCYDGVLVTEEFNRSEPDAYQLKFLAPGVGLVRVGWRGAKEDEHEVLDLVRAERLGTDALGEVRRAARAQEQRSYERRPGVFGATPPAQRDPA